MIPNELLNQLNIDKLAQRVGADPAAVDAAVKNVLPTLLLGLGANAQDPAGERSLAQALQSHDPSLVEGEINPEQVDVADGEKITRHIFGSNQDAVVQQLGGLLGNQSELVRKLLPILAPIVLAWLAGKMQQPQGQQPTEQAPQQPQTKSEPVRTDEGSLRDLLNEITGGAAEQQAQQAPQQQTPEAKQAPEAPQQAPAEQPQAQQPQQQTQQQPGGVGGAILNEILGGLLGGGRR